MPELRELFDANTCLELPSRYEAQEYSMRERYCQTIKNADQRSQLLDALKTSKAFRSFNEKIRRLGLTESWEGYRDKAFKSPCTGTEAPIHHTPWRQAMDDSMVDFMRSK